MVALAANIRRSGAFRAWSRARRLSPGVTAAGLRAVWWSLAAGTGAGPGPARGVPMTTTTTSAALLPAGPAFSDGSGGRWPGSWPGAAAWPARPTRWTCASSRSGGPAASPVPRGVSVSSSVPAWDTIPPPSPDTAIFARRAVFYVCKLPSPGSGQDPGKPYPPRSKELFASKAPAQPLDRRKAEVSPRCRRSRAHRASGRGH